jgi:Fe-S cluster assembly iron-binding protein IscA
VQNTIFGRGLRATLIACLALVAGCGPKATTHVIQVPPTTRPFVEVEPKARELLAGIATEKKLGDEWCVKLEVVWKPDAQIEVNLERKAGAKDFVVEADGLRFAMAADQKVYLKGAYISVSEVKGGVAFDVTFPNRDARDRQLAAEWLKQATTKETKNTKENK